MELETKARVIGRIMTIRVVTIEMDDSLEVVRDIFKKVQFHHLLVVDNEKLVGIISDRDMLKAVSPFVGTLSETTRDRATLNKRAHQIMTHHPVTVRSSCSLQDAAELMLAQGVSCLPVTTIDGVVLGIITWKDVLRAILDSQGISVGS
ncbi:MAG: CBS domain-containing protein [Nitrospirales bacterium]|nr:MAG: CBS domain-containing protein [Nitrospirales bacterium]